MTIIDATDSSGRSVRLQIDGATVRAIYDDALVDVLPALGDVDVQRVSHVEPYDGSGGTRFAERHPGVQWTADMRPVDGPVLGPFKTRQAALGAERQWLREQRGL